MFFKIKSLAGLVRKNNKGRKKYKKLVSFLMIVCFIICTAVDWTIISLKKSMEDIAEKPLARQLEVIGWTGTRNWSRRCYMADSIYTICLE